MWSPRCGTIIKISQSVAERRKPMSTRREVWDDDGHPPQRMELDSLRSLVIVCSKRFDLCFVGTTALPVLLAAYWVDEEGMTSSRLRRYVVHAGARPRFSFSIIPQNGVFLAIVTNFYTDLFFSELFPCYSCLCLHDRMLCLLGSFPPPSHISLSSSIICHAPW